MKKGKHEFIKIPTIIDYYGDELLAQSELFMNPEQQRSLQTKQIVRLCSKRLSTRSVLLLEKLYRTAENAYARKLLARKIYRLRQDYLNSYKEHSDRSLIMLVERDNWFDKWEGIFILGYFGTHRAKKYLKEKLLRERNRDLAHAMQQALGRIKRKKAERKRRRGF